MGFGGDHDFLKSKQASLNPLPASIDRVYKLIIGTKASCYFKSSASLQSPQVEPVIPHPLISRFPQGSPLT